MAKRVRVAVGMALAVVLVAAGCGGPAPSPPVTGEEASEQPAPAAADGVAEARLHQPFAEATRAEPPADWQRPPDVTLAGRSWSLGRLPLPICSSPSPRFCVPSAWLSFRRTIYRR